MSHRDDTKSRNREIKRKREETRRRNIVLQGKVIGKWWTREEREENKLHR